MNTLVESTVPEKILLAAHQLETQGQSPFSAEALIVASWQKFPRTFGLKGYAELYPDSNKILSSIMGEKGLARRGWLAKMGQKLYTLTSSGQQVVTRLLAGEPEAAPAGNNLLPSSKLNRDQEKFLITLFDNPAVDKFSEGRKNELTFADACRFWGITETTYGDGVRTRLERLRHQLDELDRALRKGDMELSTGRSVSLDDVTQLIDLNQHLEERFSRHLNLLRSRA